MQRRLRPEGLRGGFMRIELGVCLALLVSASAGADHACVDGHPKGKPVVLGKAFSAKWFLVGSASLTDPKTHAALKERYKEEYVSGYDEGPVGSLCLKLASGYVAVTTDPFGPGVEYSIAQPKCLKCETSRASASD